jgi:hypothetical protein
MTALRDLLHRCHWSDVQDAIRIDPTVSLRIEDSDEEDSWFVDDVRRLKSVDSTPGLLVRDRPRRPTARRERCRIGGELIRRVSWTVDHGV